MPVWYVEHENVVEVSLKLTSTTFFDYYNS